MATTIAQEPAVDIDPLRRYWHPVAESGEVGDDPVAVQLLDESLVLFRSEGAVRVFRDVCIHRGAKISRGWVKDGNIVCPYHGFAYDGTGRCVYIPSYPKDDQHIPSRLRLTPFHVEERYGLIWVSLEEPEQPLPAFPEWEDDSFHAFRALKSTWSTSAARLTENILDVSHFPHVHAGLLGDPEHPELIPFEVDVDEIGLSYRVETTPGERAMSHYESSGTWDYRLSFPFTLWMATQNAEGQSTILFSTCPRTKDECTVYIGMARNYALDRPDDEWIAFTGAVLEQDRPVVESQRPEMLPVDLREEIHLRFADKPGIEYRRLLRDAGLDYA